ncbi:MAG: hypothetical protein ABH815_01010 [Candidatus Omnitrophota bacterium]
MIFLLAVIFALLQITVARDINLLIVLVVFAGLRKGALWGLLIGGAIGILASIFSSRLFLTNVVLYAMIGFITGIARSRMFYKENAFSEIMFCFFGSMLFYSVYFILTGVPQPFILYTAFFSAVFSPLIFRIAER